MRPSKFLHGQRQDFTRLAMGDVRFPWYARKYFQLVIFCNFFIGQVCAQVLPSQAGHGGHVSLEDDLEGGGRGGEREEEEVVQASR